jgi:hypothetical protein
MIACVWRGCDLLDLSKPLDSQAVDSDDKSDKDRYPDCAVYCGVPVSNDQSSSNDLVWGDD